MIPRWRPPPLTPTDTRTARPSTRGATRPPAAGPRMQLCPAQQHRKRFGVRAGGSWPGGKVESVTEGAVRRPRGDPVRRRRPQPHCSRRGRAPVRHRGRLRAGGMPRRAAWAQGSVVDLGGQLHVSMGMCVGDPGRNGRGVAQARGNDAPSGGRGWNRWARAGPGAGGPGRPCAARPGTRSDRALPAVMPGQHPHGWRALRRHRRAGAAAPRSPGRRQLTPWW